MRRVRHVEAENVDARVHQFPDHFGGVRGRAKGGYDFGAAERSSLHGLKIILLLAIKKLLIGARAENQLAKTAPVGHIRSSI
jgi:hypothetical protein